MSAPDVRLAVIKVLGGQSPNYFIFPNAAAFVAEGLDSTEVADVLAELHDEGRVEREELLDESDPDAAPVPVPGGYRLIEEET